MTKILTTAQLVERVNEVWGIPLSKNRVHKDTMDGKGPQPCGRYGPGYLFTPEAVDEYVEKRFLNIKE